MPFDVDLQMALGHQLTKNGLPAFRVKLAAAAEGLQLMMSQLADAWRQLAPQDIDKVRCAKTLACAKHRG